MTPGETATCKACGASVPVPADALEISPPPVPGTATATSVATPSDDPTSQLHIGPTPTYRLYTPWAAFWAAFLGGPLAGFFLMRSNDLTVGDQASARKHVWWGVSMFVGIVGVGALLDQVAPSLGRTLGHLSSFGVHEIAKREQRAMVAAHKAMGGEFHSKWRAAGIGFIWLLLMLALMLGLFALSGSK